MSKIRAPELEPALAWLNTDRALSMKALRGQLVILDFWTYCCVNCMHVVPVLRDLEARHTGDPLVVIGVHSAKFDTESRPERVADAIARYGVTHPVVVDEAMGIWERYAVRSWPTLVIVRPDGTIAAVAPGEPDPDILAAFVNAQLDEARANGTLASTPFHATRATVADDRPLKFPGKIALADDGRVALADSGHHRVLVADALGNVLATIGSGVRGWTDGSFAQACFDDPQGVCFDGDALWICDTRNHVVRRADLARGTVETMAGTGEMGTGSVVGRSPAKAVSLRSPWDVLVEGERVIVAMAGAHQLWTLDARDGTVGPWAGSGREALVDGTPAESAFAQPSGLARGGDTLFVADSETSAIRAVDLASGTVRTLVGEGLFDFGDTDGEVSHARLQHALGVAVAHDGTVLVADTYNDRLRAIDASQTRVSTVYRGAGERALREPADVKVGRDGVLWVADTNAHRVVRIARDGAWLGEFEVRGAGVAVSGAKSVAGTPRASTAVAVTWFDTPVSREGGDAFGEGFATLTLRVGTPDGWKLAHGSRARVVLEVSRRSDLLELTETTFAREIGEDGALAIELDAHVSRLPDDVASEVLVTVEATLCSSGDGAACVPVRGWFRLPVALARGGSDALVYTLPLRAPA